MIEVVVVELVDRDAGAAARQERVDPPVLLEHVHRGVGLVAEVLADHTGSGGGIIRCADPVKQQEAGVGHGEGGENDDVRRLFEFFTGQEIEISHAGRAFGLFVVIDTQHVGPLTQLEARPREQDRIEQRLRRCLGLRLAQEFLAVAAILAGAEAHAVGICVSAGRVA